MEYSSYLKTIDSVDALEIEIHYQVHKNSYSHAILGARHMMDKYHRESSFVFCVGRELGLDDMEKLVVENTGSALCLAGRYHWIFSRSMNVTAYTCFKRAADQDYPLGQYLQGVLLSDGRGVPQDRKRAIELFTKASRGGCQNASWNMGNAYEKGVDGVIEQNLVRAALYYLQSDDKHHRLSTLLSRHPPRECCPFGYWRPSPALQQLVIPQVRTTLVTTMLVCKRLRVNRHVALIVASYVCTR